MKLGTMGEFVLSEQDLIHVLYKGNTNLEFVQTSKEIAEQFNNARNLNADDFSELIEYQEQSCSQDDFDIKNQKVWFIPEEYKTLDISEWLISQCNTNIEKERVCSELSLYHQYNMLDVLRCVKYLVDTMRTRNIVWGLGRGSSVASYCLYLIGIHKVDSIKYNLDIREFLKGD
jgi:DNA polymerase III alpha subunit